MDERQQGVTVGAGLEESRLNKEFIDWIWKWGPWVLIVIAAIPLSMRGLELLKQRELTKVNDAFALLHGFGSNPSPTSLEAFADEHEGMRGLSQMARLQAAGIYMDLVRRGFEHNAELDVQGLPVNEEDRLTDEDKDRYLDRADALYDKVIATSGKKGREPHLLNGYYGKAAVAETRGDLEAAARAYEEAKAVASSLDYQTHLALLDHRIETLDDLRDLPKIFDEAELPPLPGEEVEDVTVPEGPVAPDATSDDGATTDESAGDEASSDESDSEEAGTDESGTDESGSEDGGTDDGTSGGG